MVQEFPGFLLNGWKPRCIYNVLTPEDDVNFAKEVSFILEK